MSPFAFWIGGSLLVAYLGRHRRIGALGFFICSLILSPILSALMLLLTAPGKTPPSAD